MKLSLSILLVVAAALNVSASRVPYYAQACSLGTEGKALGNGFKGYCCKTQADCIDDCYFGKCTGPEGTIKATKTKSAGAKATSVHKIPYDAQACALGTEGKGLGNGYKGYCCKTEADCRDDCVHGKCTGAEGTITTTKTKSAGAKSTGVHKIPYAAQACALGTEGKGLGNGYKGYCCKTEADCRDDCVNGKCTGAEGTIKNKKN